MPSIKKFIYRIILSSFGRKLLIIFVHHEKENMIVTHINTHFKISIFWERQLNYFKSENILFPHLHSPVTSLCGDPRPSTSLISPASFCAEAGMLLWDSSAISRHITLLSLSPISCLHCCNCL